jgi:PRTRC genetic system protein B
MNQSLNNFDMQTGETELVLTNAILLYSVAGNQDHSGANNVAYAKLHEIKNCGTEARPNFQIAAGRPVTKEGVLGMFQDLAKKQTLNVDFLPENVLSISADHMVWWMPACERNVFFRTLELGTRSAKVPHPPLLFVVIRGGWSVWALPENRRPTIETALQHAPYFNVYDTGGICTGSAATPSGVAAAGIPQWESAFFDSEFTHINGSIKKASHPRGEYALWKELLDGEHKEFPMQYLVPFGSTVSKLMDGVRSRLGVAK